MQITIAAQEFDLQQIIFVIVFLLIGFVQWLFKLWQEKREQAERERKPPPSRDEVEARRRAWQRQAGQKEKSAESPPPMPVESAPPARPAKPPTPNLPIPPFAGGGGLGDLIETFRKAVEEAKSPPAKPEPTPSPAPVTPPPLPAPVVATYVEPAPALAPPQQPVHAPLAMPKAPLPPVTAIHSNIYDIKPPSARGTNTRAKQHSLTKYLRDTGGYRKAFILKEVLDAPKALKESPWPVD